MSKSIVVVSLFNGINVAPLAIKENDFNVLEVYTSEIDLKALLHENYLFPNNIKLGDVRNIDFNKLRIEIKNKYPNAETILVGGSPCQNLSFIGNNKGMATKCNIKITSLEQYKELVKNGFSFIGQSFLFWEFVRAKEELKPKYFLLENVRMAKQWSKIFSEVLKVEHVAINSDLFSAQNRPRFYWFNWCQQDIKDRKIMFYDIVD
ncbi:MAG TPA: hypothetical protein EYG85_06390, partial [Crocinitomix sp.]|nr:hypothetical protein [Crocinitomix sp.]